VIKQVTCLSNDVLRGRLRDKKCFPIARRQIEAPIEEIANEYPVLSSHAVHLTSSDSIQKRSGCIDSRVYHVEPSTFGNGRRWCINPHREMDRRMDLSELSFRAAPAKLNENNRALRTMDQERRGWRNHREVEAVELSDPERAGLSK
jgi:hypothetical protein